MKKNIFYIFVFLIFSAKGFSQDAFENQDAINYNPEIAIKFAPLCLMDYTPSLQGGLELKLADNIGFQTEIGYITTFGKVEHWLRSDPVELQGIRFRNEIRFYLSQEPGGGFYLGPEIFYKRVDEIWEESVYRYDWLYSEIVEVKETKTVFGSHIKLGKQFEIYNTNLLFDIYGGFGMRYLNIDSDEPTDESYYYSYDWFERVNGSYILPSLALGFKLGYRF